MWIKLASGVGPSINIIRGTVSQVAHVKPHHQFALPSRRLEVLKKWVGYRQSEVPPDGRGAWHSVPTPEDRGGSVQGVANRIR